MISKWYALKDEAIKLRLNGHSIREVEAKLGIPKSTLSGWFKNVKIENKYKKILNTNWKNALVKARSVAIKWHNKQKKDRIIVAENEAKKTLEEIDTTNENNMEFALAMLYLGEGFKKKSGTGIGNSDPVILKFFISILKKVYNIKVENISCFLHLRADQDSDELKQYWSKTLKIPVVNFKKSSIDKRTSGSKTYDSYKGVCVVKCGNVAIQRKLIYLSRIYCEKIITQLGG